MAVQPFSIQLAKRIDVRLAAAQDEHRHLREARAVLVKRVPKKVNKAKLSSAKTALFPSWIRD